MAMTGVVKDELSRLSVMKPCCRKAEVSTLLRFAGGLHLVSGRIVIEAELDTGAAARRLRKDIAEVFGHTSDVHRARAERAAQGQPLRRPGVRDGEALARQTGLIDNHGRPVRGLPRQVVGGGRLRRRGRVAGGVPGARLADRAGPFDVAGGDLPGARGGAGAGRLGAPAQDPRQGPRGARRRPGGRPGR